jgi:hypothetical protein
MFGPLPTRYRYLVLTVTLLGCLAMALWLSRSITLPLEGYLVGLGAGALIAYLLLHDFTHRPTS